MSTVYPTINGFVGYGDGLEAQLCDDEPWDSGHPLVAERPELFTAPDGPVPTEPGCLHPDCVLDHPHDGPAVLSPPSVAADGYDDMKLTELRDALTGRQLPTSGNKPDLVARLRAADAAAVTP